MTLCSSLWLYMPMSFCSATFPRWPIISLEMPSSSEAFLFFSCLMVQFSSWSAWWTDVSSTTLKRLVFSTPHSLASGRTEAQRSKWQCSARISRMASSRRWRHWLPLSTSTRPLTKYGRRVFSSSSYGREFVAKCTHGSRAVCSRDQHESGLSGRPALQWKSKVSYKVESSNPLNNFTDDICDQLSSHIPWALHTDHLPIWTKAGLVSPQPSGCRKQWTSSQTGQKIGC